MRFPYRKSLLFKKEHMPKCSVSLQILPDVAGDEKKLIQIVDAVIDVIRKSGINYQVGPMETTMEGELNQLISIIKKSQYLSIKMGARSVFSNLKIIYNPKGVLTIKEKLKKYR
jgi:uncharacterized protein YqgV (UPF0045/DUF77 family)